MFFSVYFFFDFYWSVAQLKPTNSYEYHPTRPPRVSGGTQTLLRTKSPTHVVVVGNLLVDSLNISSGTSTQSSNSFFDVTPDIPSPPVPPPRTNLNQKINSSPVKNNFISHNNNLLSLRDNVVALPIVPKKSLLEVIFIFCFVFFF